MTLSFWQQRNREAEIACDVAVVGGGLIGCATAYWLRRLRPKLEVVVVEAGRLASGASGRNAGFLLQGTSDDYITALQLYGPERTRRLWNFTRENQRLITSQLKPEAFDLEASGSLTVAGSRKEAERLADGVPRMRADGSPVAFLPPDEANRRLSGQGFHGALYVPSGCMLNPAALVAYVAAQSRALVLEDHPVCEVQETGEDVLLETTVRRVRAAQVVLAVNAYLPRLIPSLSRFVRPVRAQMLATEPLLPRWLPLPAYSHEGYFYLRQHDDGSLLLGGARHLHHDVERGYEDATTPALQADLERYLHHHFPQARGAHVQQRWSGVMGFSPDRLPVLGAVPGLVGSYWAAGFTGHGMGYGFRFGRLMAEVVLGFPRPEELDLFTEARFLKESEPVRLANGSTG